jgi:acetylornithine deacetylase/succinyl-diaminopimelate desuccinylase-like protein
MNLVDGIQAFWDQDVLPTLEQYIRVPCVSPYFDTQWRQRGHIDAAVSLVHQWVGTRDIRGLRVRIQQPPDRTPLIYIEVPGTGGEVIIYGHLDKQPEFHGWEPGLGPWTPVRRGDRLYGRGGADDGYAVFAAVGAVEALQRQGIRHPTARILIECSEESGSPDLAAHLQALGGALGQPDLVVVLDSEAGDYDRLWLTTSLRGYIGARLKVAVLTQGIHSGAGGGIVPAPFRIARHLLGRIEHTTTGNMPDWMKVEIPDHRIREAAATGSILKDVVTNKFPWLPGVQRPDDDPADLLVRNTWLPTMAVTALDGLPPGARASSTIEPEIELSLSIRTPPTANASQLADRIKHVLERDPPAGSSVSLAVIATSDGWSSPDNPSWLSDVIGRASNEFFGEEAASLGTGGTIPFIAMLGRQFPASSFVVTGVLGPHSNAHGPNEFLDIPTAKAVTGVVARLLEGVGTRA